MTAEFSPRTKRLIWDRATPEGYSVPVCEAQIVSTCSTVATEIHHRAGRGRNPALASPANAAALCATCHAHITQHYCYGSGWSVHRQRGLDPAEVPVSYRGGSNVWLHVDGTTSPVEGAA